jgi:hypothetical protein
MPVAVAEFVERRWPEVLRQVGAWRAKEVKGEDTLEFVLTLFREWEQIPSEEKQIPYLALERTFWASVNALHICAAATVPGAITFEASRPPDTFEAELDQHLDEIFVFLRDRKPLPEGKYVGRRHLP